MILKAVYAAYAMFGMLPSIGPALSFLMLGSLIASPAGAQDIMSNRVAIAEQITPEVSDRILPNQRTWGAFIEGHELFIAVNPRIEHGNVSALSDGKIWEITPIGEVSNGDLMVRVVIARWTPENRWVEETYTGLSEASVRQFLGFGVREGTNTPIEAGQVIGRVTEGTFHEANRPVLWFSAKVNSEWVNPETFLVQSHEALAIAE